MVEKGTGPLTRKAEAEELLERTASELRDMLREAAGALDPFPFFMGSIAVRAIETEPGAAAKTDRGCVVVCPDGELYEYTYAVAMGGPFFEPSREETLTELDLPCQDYIPYAYNALCEITKQILERQRAV